MSLVMSEDLIINLNEPPFDTEGLIAFFCGKTGAGKSYALAKMLEQLYRNKIQWVFLDPHGEGHVLADNSFDTRGDVVIVSDRYGVPVAAEAIPVYIDILKGRKSMVIDLSKLFKDTSKALFNEFIEQFLSKFNVEWTDIRTPIVLVMDEAHYFAPQKIRKGDSSAAARVDMITDLSTGGRKYGISQVYSSQRPALLDKTPVTQANLRFFGKFTSVQDWNAIKEHVKDYVSFTEIKGFTSGTFLVNIGDKTQTVKVGKRETKDAGKTPTYRATFSSTKSFDLAELTKKIQATIESAHAERELADQTTSRLKTTERENERLRSEMKDLKFQLDTVAIVEKRLGKTGTQVEVREVVAETVEQAKTKMREEFDEQLRVLRQRHQEIVSKKDGEIAVLKETAIEAEKHMDRIRRFRDSVADLLGDVVKGDFVVPPQTQVDVDMIVSRVLSKIPVGVGQTIVLEAPQALVSQLEQRQVAKMLEVIDELSKQHRDAFEVLSVLLVGDKIMTVMEISRMAFHSDSGGTRQKASEALAVLKSKSLVREHKGHGYKQNIEGFIRFYLGDVVTDVTGIGQHIVHRVAEIRGGNSGV